MNKEIIIFSNAQDGWGDDGRILWTLLAAGYENVKMVNGGYEYLSRKRRSHSKWSIGTCTL